MKENHNIKSKLTLKPYNGNVWHVNITKPIIFRIFIHLTSLLVVILVKFYCFTIPYVPELEAKSVVPELTIRDSEHCWWFPLTTHTASKCGGCICQLLSGVPDLWDHNKILRCGDLSHLHVPDCIWVFFSFVWFFVYSSQYSFLFWIMYLL